MALPDKEAIDAQVLAYAEAAREEGHNPSVSTYPQAEPQESINKGVIAPIYMGKAHEVIPDSYVVHYSIVRCGNCQAESRSNEFYALSYIKSRVNGSRVRHLVRCDVPMYNLPVRVIPTGSRKVPFCCECDSISLAHLPPPPLESNVTELPEPTLKGARPKEPKAAPKKPSIDDLI